MILLPLTAQTSLLVDKRIIEWVANRIHTASDNDWRKQNAEALGIVYKGELIAGVIYHNYFPCYKNIELSMAATSPKWAQRTSIRALLDYPFNQLGVQRVTTLTPKKNQRAIKFNLGIGFQIEGDMRQGYGDDDMIIAGLLRKDAVQRGWIDG